MHPRCPLESWLIKTFFDAGLMSTQALDKSFLQIIRRCVYSFRFCEKSLCKTKYCGCRIPGQSQTEQMDRAIYGKGSAVGCNVCSFTGWITKLLLLPNSSHLMNDHLLISTKPLTCKGPIECNPFKDLNEDERNSVEEWKMLAKSETGEGIRWWAGAHWNSRWERKPR